MNKIIFSLLLVFASISAQAERAVFLDGTQSYAAKGVLKRAFNNGVYTNEKAKFKLFKCAGELRDCWHIVPSDEAAIIVYSDPAKVEGFLKELISQSVDPDNYDDVFGVLKTNTLR